MSRILKHNKPLKLLHQGYDCDVYLISEDKVYKHYAEYKPGKKWANRKSVIPFLKSKHYKFMENVLDYDEEGFITHKNDFVAGSYLYYNSKFPYALRTINKLKQLDFCHLDIHPGNIMYRNSTNSIIIIDWTQVERKPSNKYNEDLRRWQAIDKNRYSEWFWDRNDDLKVFYGFLSEITLRYVYSQPKMNMDEIIQFLNKELEKTYLIYQDRMNLILDCAKYLIDNENMWKDSLKYTNIYLND